MLKTIMHKFYFNNNSCLNLLIDVWGDPKPQDINQETPITFSVAAYTIDSEHGGNWPETLNTTSEGKISLEEFLGRLSDTGINLTVDEFKEIYRENLQNS